MRVLHLVPFASDNGAYGGPVTVAIEQATELRRRGIDVVLAGGWLGSGPPPEQLRGVPARLFPVRRAFPGPRFAGLVSPGLTRWLQRDGADFDVAHVHLSRDLVCLRAIGELRRRRVPYVTQTHGMVAADSRLLLRLLDRLVTGPALAGAACRFALNSEESGRVDQLSRGAVPTVRLRNGVAIPSIQLQRPDSAAAGPDVAEPNVLFLARLHPCKQVLVFAEAARMLVADGVRASFSIVGPDGGDLAALETFRSEHGLHQRLRYEGAVVPEAVAGRLGAADVYVLPSSRDSFPMSVLEALALGVPTICSAATGIAEDLRSTAAALVVSPNAEDMAQAIRRLVQNPDERRALGAAGARAAREFFGVEAVGARLVTSYQGAVVFN